MSQYRPMERTVYDEYFKDKVSNIKSENKKLSEIKEIFQYLDNEGITDYAMWNKAYIRRYIQKSEYNRKPIRVRKDNKTSINWGSGGGNRSSIRYPKKCGKTAWKRFYKLFPHLKENNEK